MIDALDKLERQTKENIARLKDHLADGGALSFEQYRQYVGRIEGAQLVLTDLYDIRQDYIDE